ncbi:response regulator [Planococcus salinus]|uniref:Transcriptional regulatory protein n=1 Tax=Planococcus salinus TaxID=1848460 RepID=A0A3M8P5N1_9BACL|nr:response regulator [Planococcus salinus]RNF38988.1 response regulator [Planococcus salinus]
MIKVMIVEDDPMVAALNRQYVEQLEGFAVVASSSNAKEAEKVLAKTEVNLLLLDIHMPGMDGIDFLREIREERLDLDVILITAASEIGRIQQALRLGAVDYLIKPFEFSRFQEALTQYRSQYAKLEDKGKISQQDLDRMLHKKSQPGSGSPKLQSLPKGLTKTTLSRISEVILSKGTEAFSTEEIAEASQISRVSIRKYLKFLTQIGYLEETLIYGVGRPIYQYRQQPSKEDRIHLYL